MKTKFGCLGSGFSDPGFLPVTVLLRHLSQRLPRRGKHLVDLNLAMCCRHKRGLKLTRRQPRAALQHRTVKPRKRRRIRPTRACKIRHGTRRKEPRKHAAHAIGREPNPMLRRNPRNAVGNRRSRLLKLRVDRIPMFQQIPNRRDPRSHREGIPTQRSRLIHRPQRRKKIHDLRAPAKHAHRQPPANDLAKRRQIRRIVPARKAEQLLRTTGCQPEARHHFIKN